MIQNVFSYYRMCSLTTDKDIDNDTDNDNDNDTDKDRY